MKLYELINDIKVLDIKGDTIVDVKSIKIDSSKVKRGDLFICIEGTKSDGHKYAAQAIANGAVGVICSKIIRTCNVPVILVSNTRKVYSMICAKFFNYPTRKMNVISVTGTNGKTTTTYILKAIFEEAGFECGVIGTNGCKSKKFNKKLELTTPDPYELNFCLAKMRDNGVKYVFLEASAHAIFFDKLLGIQAKAGIFTNISQDHLDFFDNMTKYARVKMSYFRNGFMKIGVVNIDDSYGKMIVEKRNIPCLTYGMNNPSDVFAINFELVENGSKFIVNLFDEIIEIETPLYGIHNMYNILGASTVAKALGIRGEVIVKAMSKIKPIEGRFNVIFNKDRLIIIDFAHSPDSLANLLKSARRLTKNELIAVFGCGGNRDNKKRPLMGEIAGKLADYTIITSDNPRFEEPNDIIQEIEKGIKSTKSEYNSITSRYDAIEFALSKAMPGDTVVIAGKGAENYIDSKGIKTPYSDKETVLKIL